jgi:hypothetical protein
MQAELHHAERLVLRSHDVRVAELTVLDRKRVQVLASGTNGDLRDAVPQVVGPRRIHRSEARVDVRISVEYESRVCPVQQLPPGVGGQALEAVCTGSAAAALQSWPLLAAYGQSLDAIECATAAPAVAATSTPATPNAAMYERDLTSVGPFGRGIALNLGSARDAPTTVG